MHFVPETNCVAKKEDAVAEKKAKPSERKSAARKAMESDGQSTMNQKGAAKKVLDLEAEPPRVR